MTKCKEEGVCLFFKRNIAHLTHRRALRTLIIASAERLKSLFLCRQILPEHFVIGQNTSPKRIIVLLSYPQSGMNALHIVIGLKNVTLVSNKESILVEMFDFAVTQVENFCKNELITVMFKVFDGKDASLVLFKSERYSNLSVQMFSYILVTMTEQFVFCFCKSNLKFRFRLWNLPH